MWIFEIIVTRLSATGRAGFLSLPLILLLCGCVGTNRLADHTMPVITPRPAIVEFRCGATVRDVLVKVEADSTRWLDPRTGRIAVVPTSDLEEVRVSRRVGMLKPQRPPSPEALGVVDGFRCDFCKSTPELAVNC